MARTKRQVKALPTIWRVPDDLWDQIQPILNDLDPAAHTGRKRTDVRAALDGIIYEMRTGCQWNALPREFGDDSSVHRTLQRWIAKDVLTRIWALLVESCQELGGVDWQWQAADGALSKARFGGTRLGRIPRIGRKTA
jgi:putative transposase